MDKQDGLDERRPAPSSRKLSYSRAGRRAWLLRLLLRIPVVLSLLLCIGLGYAWYRSYHGMDDASCYLGNRYELDVTAPTDGLTFFFGDQDHPGSPAYRPGVVPAFSTHAQFSFSTTDYMPVGFRDDLADTVVMMSHHPFFKGSASRGKFSRFYEASSMVDGIHEINFGWGIQIPMWFAVMLTTVLPVIGIVRRIRRRG